MSLIAPFSRIFHIHVFVLSPLFNFNFIFLIAAQTCMHFYKQHSKLPRTALKYGSQRNVQHDEEKLLSIHKASTCQGSLLIRLQTEV